MVMQNLYISKAVDKAESTALWPTEPRMLTSKPARLERRLTLFLSPIQSAAAAAAAVAAAAAMVLTIMDLSLEMLMLVFGFLSLAERARTVAQVCSSWRVICQAPLFWTEITLPRQCVNDVPERIQAYRRMLAQHADHIKTLRVVHPYCEVSDTFHELKFPNLKAVRLYYISVAFARTLVNACPSIEDLVVSYNTRDLNEEVFDTLCSWRQVRRVNISCQIRGSGSDRIYSRLFHSFQHLEWVNLRFGNCKALSDDGLNILAKHHHGTLSRFALNSDELTTLAPLLDCRWLTHLEVQISSHIPDGELVALSLLPQLTHLELSFTHPSLLALCRIFNRGLKFTHLRLMGWNNLTSEVMARIATSCCQLQHLYIECDSITNNMVLPLFDQLPHLHSLGLMGGMKVTPDILQLFPSKLPQLKQLCVEEDDEELVGSLLLDIDLNMDLDYSWFCNLND